MQSCLKKITICAFVVALPRTANGFQGVSVGRSSTSALHMAQNRGLEVRREGATPTEGGMTLYVKSAEDGTTGGDCPFAHFVRMVLEEKGLEYDLKPSTQDTKPNWLVEHYGGKMPALRHKKECYVDSEVIAEYLDFFFPEPQLKGKADAVEVAEDAVDGIFPAIAKYLKHTPDGDEDDLALKEKLEEKLGNLESYLADSNNGRSGSFLVGDGASISLVDCSLAPKLFHMDTGINGFKEKSIDLEQQFPKVREYMDYMFAHPSFETTTYPKETILWGWGNARGA